MDKRTYIAYCYLKVALNLHFSNCNNLYRLSVTRDIAVTYMYVCQDMKQIIYHIIEIYALANGVIYACSIYETPIKQVIVIISINRKFFVYLSDNIYLLAFCEGKRIPVSKVIFANMETLFIVLQTMCFFFLLIDPSNSEFCKR